VPRGGAEYIKFDFNADLEYDKDHSAFIKYAEAALSAKSREAGGGGMHLTLRKSFKRAGATLSATYATLALLLSLSMGAALQSSAFVGITSSIGVAAPIAAVLLLALTLLATFGGKDRISKITEIIIPLTTVIYIIMSFLAIIRAPRPISEVLSQIISEAFRPSSAGGALAFFTSRALCEGFARGMLSNEAGAGTSSLGHTAADGKPHEAGLFGAVEVFFDTTLLCTLTALVILTSVPDPSAFSAPMYLVSAAFSESLGSASLYPLTASVLAFAFSTVICWFYYGREMTLYLSGKSRLLMHVFSLGFYLLVLFGGFLPDLILISVNDVLLLFLTLLTSSVLLLRSPELYQITAESGLLR